MLNEFQRNKVWENMLAAETRSLYFGDLASRYTRRKQIITGISFFLASGAAATLVAKSPMWVPLALSIVVALATAYAMAVNLDGKIWTMAKLHSAWTSIVHEYARLWSHTEDPDAKERLDKIVEREREPSQLAAAEAPNDQKLLGTWQDRVIALYRLTGQHG
jgi:hypothetical protein